MKRSDPFAPLAPLLASARTAPLHPVIFLTGDDDWIVAEGARRVAPRSGRPSARERSRVYEATGEGVKEAVADAATIALFATNRLVVLEATELFRGKGLTAEELDALLDEAEEAGDDARLKARLARRASALAAAAGVTVGDDLEEAARRIAGRVKRVDRAAGLAALLASLPASEEGAETALDTLLDYAQRASASDNVLLVHRGLARWRTPRDPGPEARLACWRTCPCRTRGRAASVSRRSASSTRSSARCSWSPRCSTSSRAADDSSRGRSSRTSTASSTPRAAARVTSEEAARQIADESKEYGSDFVEAVAGRDLLQALRLLVKLLSGATFTAFRPWGEREEAPAGKKGPRGEAAFFPLLGLLAAELRRMLALRAALDERGVPPAAGRRTDYRGFVDRVLPALKAPRRAFRPSPSRRIRSSSTRRFSQPSAGPRRSSGARSRAWKRSTEA